MYINTHPNSFPFSEMWSLVLSRPNSFIFVLETVYSYSQCQLLGLYPLCLIFLSLHPSLDLFLISVRMGVCVNASVYLYVSLCLSLQLWAHICGALYVCLPSSFSVALFFCLFLSEFVSLCVSVHICLFLSGFSLSLCLLLFSFHLGLSLNYSHTTTGTILVAIFLFTWLSPIFFSLSPLLTLQIYS